MICFIAGLFGANCFFGLFFVVFLCAPEELSNLDLGDALRLGKKCGDQEEKKGIAARVDEEGPAESDGVDEVAIGEDRGEDGEAGHGDRQTGHQAAKLFGNITKTRELGGLDFES